MEKIKMNKNCFLTKEDIVNFLKKETFYFYGRRGTEWGNRIGGYVYKQKDIIFYSIKLTVPKIIINNLNKETNTTGACNLYINTTIEEGGEDIIEVKENIEISTTLSKIQASSEDKEECHYYYTVEDMDNDTLDIITNKVNKKLEKAVNIYIKDFIKQFE